MSERRSRGAQDIQRQTFTCSYVVKLQKSCLGIWKIQAAQLFRCGLDQRLWTATGLKKKKEKSFHLYIFTKKNGFLKSQESISLAFFSVNEQNIEAHIPSNKQQ